MNTKLHITGIVVEYNPLHYGHIHHILETRKITQCDVLIAVMSPHFVQRGEPAIVDKWIRTEAALKHGVDLVIELPTYYALQSAEHFAKSALDLLHMAQVDSIVYGSETLEKPELGVIDKDALKAGHAYAYAKNSQHLKSNQILGAYYEKFASNHNIKTHRILRTIDYHDLSMNHKIASASGIRHAYFKGINTQNNTPLILDAHNIYKLEDYYPLIRYQILTEQAQLNQYLLVDEGIENHFIKLALKHDNLDDFIKDATSKRYTQSKIQRTLCHILLKHPRNPINIEGIRVLGMNKTGQAYLNQIKKETKIYTQFKDYPFKDLELKAAFIYGLPYKKEDALLQREMQPPIII